MIKYILVLIVSIGVFGCHSTRKIKSTISALDTARAMMPDSSIVDSAAYIKEIYNAVQKNRIDFNAFSAKIKVEYWDKDGRGPDLVIVTRVRKDSVIWISVNATVFSYEAFRVLITPDSVKVLNKKDKVLTRRSINYLQEVAKLPFDFYTLQDLIVGNPVYFDKNIVSFKKNADNITVMSKGDVFKNLLTLNSSNYLVQNSKLDDVNALRNRTGYISYSDYETKNGQSFPLKRRVSISEKSKLDVNMEFKQYNFNESLTFPFGIPPGYKVN